MYLIALHKFVKKSRDEGRRAEIARSRIIFASLTSFLRASMVPAFAVQLGQDLASLMPEHHAAVEQERNSIDPVKVLAEFNKGVKEMEKEEW